MDAPNTEQKSASTISPQRAAIIALLIALFGPLAMQYYNYGGSMSNDFTIVAMAWIYYSNSWMGPFSGLMIDPFMLISSLPFTFLRFAFAYMLYRLYCGKTTHKRVLLTGILMELFLPVFYLIMYLPMLLMGPGWYGPPLLIPIPILLLYGMAIVKVYPPPQEKLWIETEKTEYWWEESKETEEPMKSSDTSPSTEDTASQTGDDVTTQTKDDWLSEN
ncbi:MAG: hypothetical protein P1Q69_06190 [Candidatus Thorarchaeota archaeon]|nr:hypothetical protein [Candidatus Thorarchaeota archaeon]